MSELNVVAIPDVVGVEACQAEPENVGFEIGCVRHASALSGENVVVEG